MRVRGLYLVEVENPNGDSQYSNYCHSLKEVKDTLNQFCTRMTYVYKIKKNHKKCIFVCSMGKIYVDIKPLFGRYINNRWGEGYYLWDERVQ